MGHLIWEDSKMNFEGKLVGKDLKIAIVVSRFNDFITTFT